ncbi:hypothetical protein HED60_08795 [Planctomycetales bacterium ZRK34]|nr:hypothetical protein HED60_08795 [Planctomycetales bacterium ZRK34]
MDQVRDDAAQAAELRAQERQQGDPIPPAGGVAGKWFRLIAQGPDYNGDVVLGKEWDWEADDFVEGAEEVYIAKPPRLRESYYSAKTINGIRFSVTGENERRSTNTNVGYEHVQNEVIYPPYLNDDDSPPTIIYAIDTDNAGVEIGGTYVTWQDQNVDGRAWQQTRCGA